MDIKFHIATANMGTVLLHLIDKNVNSATKLKRYKRLHEIRNISILLIFKAYLMSQSNVGVTF